MEFCYAGTARWFDGRRCLWALSSFAKAQPASVQVLGQRAPR